jgi:hypothetical protein
VCDLPDEQCVDKSIADSAVELLGVLAATGKPFFFSVGFHKPHPFWSVPQRFQDMYLPGGSHALPLPTHPEPPTGMPATAFYSCKSIRDMSDVGGPNCDDPELNKVGREA